MANIRGTWRGNLALMGVGAVLVGLGVLIQPSAVFIGGLLGLAGFILLAAGALNLLLDWRAARRG